MSLSWRTDWQTLAAEIDGLQAAAHMYLACQTAGMTDITALRDVLVPHSGRIFNQLGEFHDRTKALLPQAASAFLAAFIANHQDLFGTSAREMNGHIQHRLTALASLRAELEHLLADFGARARRLADRAFLHLQRSIVVDQSVRQEWTAAYRSERGEERCEQLGAVHLLLHGIWAFKINAKGEQTDLVYPEPLTDQAAVDQAAEALVLTEWKIVATSEERDKRLRRPNARQSSTPRDR